RVPLLATPRAALRPRLGADDRAPRPLRGGRPAADRAPEGFARQGRRRPGREDRPRGGLPPAARRDVGGPLARRAALPGGIRGAVAVRSRDARARPPPRAGRAIRARSA